VNEVVKGAIGSWPIIFVGSIMLTEPSTLPPTTYYQLLVAALVGIIFTSELHVGNLSASPQAALIAGNIFTLLAVPTFGAVLQLKKITKLSLNVYDLAFEKPSRNFKFTPGQYIEWTLQHAGTDIRGNRRTFSIASAPSEPEVHIGIKQYEPGSTFKKALTGLKAGKYIRVAHVAGNFTLPADAKQPLLFIAGGIGITPFRSMVTHLTAIGQKRDVILLYIAATDQDFVYRSDMDAATVVGVRTLYETGRLTKEQIAQLVPDVAKRTVYLSGPDAMVTGYKNMVRSLGVRRTKTDHFTGY
jgi:ferredoxin-NADP reductase